MGSHRSFIRDDASVGLGAILRRRVVVGACPRSVGGWQRLAWTEVLACRRRATVVILTNPSHYGCAQSVDRVGGYVSFARRLGPISVITLAISGWLVATADATAKAAAATGPGYWLAGSDGGVFNFGATFFGSAAAQSVGCRFSTQAGGTFQGSLGCVGMASDPDGRGYWLLNAHSQATPYGSAALNPQSCTSLNGATANWTGMAVATNGQGFWLVSSSGAVMGCGTIPAPLGGTQNLTLAAPIVGMAATPDRGGYWLAGSDGGVFAFGDAAFYGSTGGMTLDKPIVGIAATTDGKGYWLVASDGGVFAFGDLGRSRDP